MVALQRRPDAERRLMRDEAAGEVIVEFVRHGAFLKCSAVHVASGIEVSATGPAHEPRELERIAIAKLKRALAARAAG